MKKITLLLLLLTFTVVFAKADTSVDLDSALRSDGKIYVVVSIICIIFLGLATYLFSIDRRLKKIEKEK
jgi:CcmD family protein